MSKDLIITCFILTDEADFGLQFGCEQPVGHHLSTWPAAFTSKKQQCVFYKYKLFYLIKDKIAREQFPINAPSLMLPYQIDYLFHCRKHFENQH